MQETWVWFLGGEDLLEKEMAAYSSILACRIPWTEEPGDYRGHQGSQSQTQLSRMRRYLQEVCRYRGKEKDLKSLLEESGKRR